MKRIKIIALSACLLVALVGCGSTENTTAEDVVTTATSTEATTEEEKTREELISEEMLEKERKTYPGIESALYLLKQGMKNPTSFKVDSVVVKYNDHIDTDYFEGKETSDNSSSIFDGSCTIYVLYSANNELGGTVDGTEELTYSAKDDSVDFFGIGSFDEAQECATGRFIKHEDEYDDNDYLRENYRQIEMTKNHRAYIDSNKVGTKIEADWFFVVDLDDYENAGFESYR